jgi:hypothetical protein
MPTVLRVGPYRFFFYAGDRDEPPNIHVERDDEVCKFWRARSDKAAEKRRLQSLLVKGKCL